MGQQLQQSFAFLLFLLLFRFSSFIIIRKPREEVCSIFQKMSIYAQRLTEFEIAIYDIFLLFFVVLDLENFRYSEYVKVQKPWDELGPSFRRKSIATLFTYFSSLIGFEKVYYIWKFLGSFDPHNSEALKQILLNFFLKRSYYTIYRSSTFNVRIVIICTLVFSCIFYIYKCIFIVFLTGSYVIQVCNIFPILVFWLELYFYRRAKNKSAVGYSKLFSKRIHVNIMSGCQWKNKFKKC